MNEKEELIKTANDLSSLVQRKRGRCSFATVPFFASSSMGKLYSARFLSSGHLLVLLFLSRSVLFLGLGDSTFVDLGKIVFH